MKPATRLRYCSFCDQSRLFRKSRFRHWRHLGLTILTGGLWSVGWLSSWIHWQYYGPERCSACHHRCRDLSHDFPTPEPEVLPTPDRVELTGKIAEAA